MQDCHLRKDPALREPPSCLTVILNEVKNLAKNRKWQKCR